MKKILCVGEALIDMICTDKGIPLSKGVNFLKKAGGAPANVSAAIAALGGKVDLVAKVGEDPFGQHLVELLDDMQVGTRFLLRDKAYFTTLAFVSLMETGERDFYFNRGADAHLSIDDLESVQLQGYGIIHFGSATAFLPGPLQEAYFYLLREAKRLGIFISFDPNYRELLFGQQKSSFTSQSWQFLHQCDYFKVSDEEAFLLTGVQTIKEAADIFLKETNAVFTITLGAAGTLIGMNGKTETIASIPITPVDTTGAGDAFVGAVLSQLQAMGIDELVDLSQYAWKKIIMNANKAGAKTCTYFGAMEAFRHLNKQIFE